MEWTKNITLASAEPLTIKINYLQLMYECLWKNNSNSGSHNNLTTYIGNVQISQTYIGSAQHITVKET